MSTLIEIPKWLRTINIIVGALTIVLAILCLVFINQDLQNLIILAVALIIIGILRTTNGIFQKYIEWYVRVLKIAVGILVIPIAIAILALSSNIVTQRVISLFAIALILSSISIITVGNALTEYPNWYKIVTVLIGILTIVAAGIALLFSQIALPTLVALIAVIFVASGIGWIYAGIKEIEEA